MAFRLFSLKRLATQVSKPISEFVTNRAKHNSFFRNHICIPTAQCYNWCEVKLERLGTGIGKNVHIPRLDDEKAIELVANLLGELIVLSIISIWLYYKFVKPGRKEISKKEARIDGIAQAKHTMQELYFKVQQNKDEIRKLMRIAYALQGGVTARLETHTPVAFKLTPTDQPVHSPSTSSNTPLPTAHCCSSKRC